MVTSPQPGTATGPDGQPRTPWAVSDPLLMAYYDSEWGRPVRDERGVFERLTLESFQAGLSWLTILRKRPAFRTAFANFVVDEVAEFHADAVERLMLDDKIVRNRAKILAAIVNARATQRLRADGGLAALIWSFQPATTPMPLTMADIPTQSAESVALAQALKTRGFQFLGPTTCYALMEAIGMVDTHVMGSYRRGVSGLWPA